MKKILLLLILLILPFPVLANNCNIFLPLIPLSNPYDAENQQRLACETYQYSEWSQCNSNGTKTREIIDCSPESCSKYVGGSVEPITEMECSPVCTDIVYTDWSNECINSQQTREVLEYVPNNCEGGVYGSAVLSRDCYSCTGRIYSNWSDCVDGKQERVVLSKTPSGCVGELETTPALSQPCRTEETKAVEDTCVDWIYSDWSNCLDNQKTRTIEQAYPIGCIGGNPKLSEDCTVNYKNEVIVPNTTKVKTYIPIKLQEEKSETYDNQKPEEIKIIPEVKSVREQISANVDSNENIVTAPSKQDQVNSFKRFFVRFFNIISSWFK